MNKPIYAGMCILDLSKLHMYQFHYDVIKKTYQDKAKLLFTDTDSLCYHIRCDDFYKDMRDSKELYDMSDFDSSSEFYDDTNKKVLGKFKDECDGKPPSEFVGLRPKMYSLRCGTSEKKTGKQGHPASLLEAEHQSRRLQAVSLVRQASRPATARLLPHDTEPATPTRQLRDQQGGIVLLRQQALLTGRWNHELLVWTPPDWIAMNTIEID